MSTLAKSFLTPQKYLKVERQAEHKSEYFAGEMSAMVGAAERHNLICMNISMASCTSSCASGRAASIRATCEFG